MNRNPYYWYFTLQDLIELKEKLLTTRELPPSIKGVGFSYGTNSEYLKYFLEYWKNEYNWKEREFYFNRFPQFTTRISGLDIHYVHVKPNLTLIKGRLLFYLKLKSLGKLLSLALISLMALAELG